MPIQFSTEDVRAYLRKHPQSAVARILDDLCPGFSVLPDTERLRVWTQMRSTLRRMEEKGQVVCTGTHAGNTWSLRPADKLV